MNTQAIAQRYLPYRSAADYSGMSAATLRRLVEAGRLRVYRPTGGRVVVFDRDELDSFIHGHHSEASSAVVTETTE